QLVRRLDEEIASEILSRRVRHLERLQVVQILMVKAVDDLVHRQLQIFEVKEQADFVELLSAQRDSNLVVVAVGIFTLPPITTQCVARGKAFFYADFEHSVAWRPLAPVLKRYILARPNQESGH